MKRQKKDGRLSVTKGVPLYRAASIFALASYVMGGDDLAMQWLHRAQYGLGEEIPIEVMRTEKGIIEVENLLLRIEYGVYS